MFMHLFYTCISLCAKNDLCYGANIDYIGTTLKKKNVDNSCEDWQKPNQSLLKIKPVVWEVILCLMKLLIKMYTGQQRLGVSRLAKMLFKQ